MLLKNVRKKNMHLTLFTKNNIKSLILKKKKEEIKINLLFLHLITLEKTSLSIEKNLYEI